MFSTCVARSDRYSHDFISDEEDGDDEAFQSPFENYTSTAPRFSVMLERHQLSFEEENSEGSSRSPTKKGSLALEEPKHEKRDSGIAGVEVYNVKILEDRKVKLLHPSPDPELVPTPEGQTITGGGGEEKSDSMGKELEDDDVETEGEGAAGGDGDSTENENGDDATGIVTNIDDELSDEEKDDITPPSTIMLSLTVPTVSIPSARPNKPLLLSAEQPLPPPATITPSRPISDYSSLVRAVDSQSATFPRPTSDHVLTASALMAPGSSHTAPRLVRHNSKRRHARMEDISKLSILTRDLDITVSPPTPGTCS